MLRLIDFKTEVTKITVKSGVNTRIPLWIHAVENQILSRYPFWFMVESAPLTTVADKAVYVLDSRCDGRRISNFVNESDDGHVCYDHLASMLWKDPTPTETGNAQNFTFMGLAKVQNQPSASSQLSISSNNSEDTGKKIIVRGLVSGIYMTEEVQLDSTNATTAVTTTNSFDADGVESIQKEDVTSGTITVTADSGSTTVVKIPPKDIAIEAPKVRLKYVPSEAQTLKYYFYKKVRRLTNDYDTPTIPEQFQWECLINGVLAIAFYNNQDYQQGQLFESKMEAGIKKLIQWGQPTGVARQKLPPGRMGRGSSLRNLYDYDSLDNYGTP